MRNSFERESEGTLVPGGLPIAKDTGFTDALSLLVKVTSVASKRLGRKNV